MKRLLARMAISPHRYGWVLSDLAARIHALLYWSKS
jgi:hypothetical protein